MDHNPSIQPGHRIGRYEITKLLGVGLFGHVYAAKDTQLERNVAVKVDRHIVHNKMMGVSREAILLASMHHQGLMKVWDFGEYHGRHYSVFELLSTTIKDELDNGVPSFERAINWLYSIAMALDYIHRRSILHLDIRAGTVFLDSTGEVRLGEFGIAQAIDSGNRRNRDFLSPRYLAPEQLKGKDIGRCTDIWALGKLMYLLVTGQAPFKVPASEIARDWIKATSQTPIAPSAIVSGLPSAIDSLCFSCLESDVSRREQDAATVARKLRPWLGTAGSARVFVSYASADRERVESDVVSVLETNGFRTWYCREDVKSASLWERSILDALEASDWFLVVMTPASQRSEWVKDEVHWAIDHRPGRIVPVMLDNCDPGDFHIRLRRLQAINLRDSQASENLVSVFRQSKNMPS
jgi:serine/threonine protein kinase